MFELVEKGAGWGFGHETPIRATTAQRAMDLARALQSIAPATGPRAFPTSDGKVLLAWDLKSKDLEVYVPEDGPYEVMIDAADDSREFAASSPTEIEAALHP